MASRGRPREVPARAEPSLAGTEFEAEVGPVAHGGHCVARHEGRVVFVRHALPGELVRVRVTHGREGDRFLRGDAVAVLRASEHRVEPPCPYARPGRCGGCDWQHARPEYSRELKGRVVAEQLRRLAEVELTPVVEPVPGDEDGLRWRTRVEFVVDPSGRLGLHRHHSHEVVPVEDCLIATRRVLGSGVLTRDWAGQRSVDVVDPSGGAAVVVPVPGGERDAPDVVERVTVERAGGRRWSGEFVVGARGFWQVHPGAAATFVAAVLGGLAPRAGERAVDLYGGVGRFTAALADAVGPLGSVLAVESDAVAARHAAANLAGFDWVEVRRGRVERVLGDVLARDGRADLVVLDPPRTGAGRAVVEQVAALRPRAIAYVACDPAALARDVAYAREAGYRLDGLRAFDAFPMTHHVECVALLVPAAAATAEHGVGGGPGGAS